MTMTRGRLLLLVAVAVALAAGSGVATFAVRGGFTTGATTTASTARPPVECGVSSRCIPSPGADEVAHVLTSQGFHCDGTSRSLSSSWDCSLGIGVTIFSLSLQSRDGRIREFTATASGPPDSEPGVAARPFFTWAASLPFADHPPSSAELSAWVERELDKGADTQAKVGGYLYTLSHKQVSDGWRYVNLRLKTPTQLEERLDDELRGG
jgi:hypothetical protein